MSKHNKTVNNVNYIELAKKLTGSNFLIQKHYSLPESFGVKYLYYKCIRLATKIHYKLFNITHPNRPWTSPGSILFFDKVLNNNMIGLEYGSGRSTLYFAKKFKKLVSIEHYEGWYENVKKMLTDNEINNVDYFLFPKKRVPNNIEDLDIYMNEHNKFESKKTFTEYYTKVNEYPDNFFDFILIDGRARVRCGLNAIPKLKKGGIFVLDNSERERYKPLIDNLNSWSKINTTNGITDTTIWIKPL